MRQLTCGAAPGTHSVTKLGVCMSDARAGGGDEVDVAAEVDAVVPIEEPLLPTPTCIAPEEEEAVEEEDEAAMLSQCACCTSRGVWDIARSGGNVFANCSISPSCPSIRMMQACSHWLWPDSVGAVVAPVLALVRPPLM